MNATSWANDRLRLAVTAACNLRCFYCHNEGQPGRSAFLSDALFERILHLLAATTDSPLSAITYTGGEALLHPGLEWMVEGTARYARRRTLVTNGWLLSEARLKSLLGAGLTKIRLGVDSLERPKSRPTATTGGTVRPILEVIDMVLSQGIEMELNVVLTQYNRREVPNLIAFCRDRSLSAKFFERVAVARFASFRDAALMRSLPVPGFQAFLEAAKAIDPSLKVAEVAPLGGANELIETNGAKLRYCRFLCDFRMCYVTGTRIDADGVVYNCMRSSRDLRLSENQTLDRSREVLQQVAHGRCEQTVVECA